jgi:hypothetical protein
MSVCQLSFCQLSHIKKETKEKTLKNYHSDASPDKIVFNTDVSLKICQFRLSVISDVITPDGARTERAFTASVAVSICHSGSVTFDKNVADTMTQISMDVRLAALRARYRITKKKCGLCTTPFC